MSAIDVVPLIKAPESWPTALTAAVSMAGLAGLDIVGALAAKNWAHTRSAAAMLLGVVAFVLLFWLYASALQYAELAIVTMGWIVLLQVSLLVVDAVKYGVEHSTTTWAAIMVIFAAQTYLILGSSGSSS